MRRLSAILGVRCSATSASPAEIARGRLGRYWSSSTTSSGRRQEIAIAARSASEGRQVVGQAAEGFPIGTDVSPLAMLGHGEQPGLLHEAEVVGSRRLRQHRFLGQIVDADADRDRIDEVTREALGLCEEAQEAEALGMPENLALPGGDLFHVSRYTKKLRYSLAIRGFFARSTPGCFLGWRHGGTRAELDRVVKWPAYRAQLISDSTNRVLFEVLTSGGAGYGPGGRR